jgi:hypothetical protein
MNDAKIILFTRWLATNYADTHLDSNMKSEYDEGFNSSEALSVLNRETGYWYIKMLKYFNDTVYPKYVESGVVQEYENFLDSSTFING